MDKELLKKAKETMTVDELKTLLSESNLNLDEGSVEKLYARIHSDEELSDEELEGLSGGFLGGWPMGKDYRMGECPRCFEFIEINSTTRWGRCHKCGFEGKVR